MRCISHACIISYNDWRLIEKYGAVINICRPVLGSLKGPTELQQMSHESANENNIVVSSIFKSGFLFFFLFFRRVLFISDSLRFHIRILFSFTYLFIWKFFVCLTYIRTSFTIIRYTSKIDKFRSVKKQRFLCFLFFATTRAFVVYRPWRTHRVTYARIKRITILLFIRIEVWRNPITLSLTKNTKKIITVKFNLKKSKHGIYQR